MVEALQAPPTANGLRAALGAAAGMAIAALALSPRGLTGVGPGDRRVRRVRRHTTWTWTDTPVVPWAVFAVEGLILAAWTFPWFRDALRLPRIGAAWLGIAYWPLGILSVVLTATWTIGAQRVAFFGLALLTGIAAVRRGPPHRQGPDGRRGSGVPAGDRAAVPGRLGHVFDDAHAVPGNAGAPGWYPLLGRPRIPCTTPTRSR